MGRQRNQQLQNKNVFESMEKVVHCTEEEAIPEGPSLTIFVLQNKNVFESKKKVVHCTEEEGIPEGPSPTILCNHQGQTHIG